MRYVPASGGERVYLTGLREPAAVVRIILGGITLVTLILARHYGLKLGIAHGITSARERVPVAQRGPAASSQARE